VVAAWDAADLASHERAAAKLEQAKDGLFSAMRSVLGLLQVWTEVDAQSFLVTLFKQLGLECDHPPIVAFNVHAGDPHYAPHPSLALQLKHGDLVLVDLWAREKERPDGGPGAYADITWMATAAETPPPDQMHIWETVRDARDTAVRFLKDRLTAGHPPQGGVTGSTSTTSRPTTRVCSGPGPPFRSSPASTCPPSASARRSTWPSRPAANCE
jgi:Xaa-Pro aminopeptidase